MPEFARAAFFPFPSDRRAECSIFEFRHHCGGGGSAFVVIDDFVTNINALVADINARSGDQLFDFILRLTAKRTT